METYRIVLADDHTLFRSSLRQLLHGVKDLEVVGEANDGLELLQRLKRISPHIVILDISMPNLRGIEAIPEIKAIDRRLRILILTMHRERTYVLNALWAGADGYLLKEDAAQDLFAAIEAIRIGKRYVSPKLRDEAVEACLKTGRAHDGAAAPPKELAEPLTLREREVLKLAAEGKSSKEAAKLLGISFRTVENHRGNIFAKLRLKGTADLVKYAIAHGYLLVDPVYKAAVPPDNS
jgi:DNA-binding NarL/FixJ family response regulator